MFGGGGGGGGHPFAQAGGIDPEIRKQCSSRVHRHLTNLIGSHANVRRHGRGRYGRWSRWRRRWRLPLLHWRRQSFRWRHARRWTQRSRPTRQLQLLIASGRGSGTAHQSTSERHRNHSEPERPTSERLDLSSELSFTFVSILQAQLLTHFMYGVGYTGSASKLKDRLTAYWSEPRAGIDIGRVVLALPGVSYFHARIRGAFEEDDLESLG